MRRVILTIILTIGMFVTISASTAYANSSPLCTQNGSYCAGDTGLTVGDNVVDKTLSDARGITPVDIDNGCGPSPCIRQYLKFYNGDYMAATSNCSDFSPVVVKAPSATIGIVWDAVYNIHNNTTTFWNQHCAGFEMYSPNSLDFHWGIDTGGFGGHFYVMKGIF